VDAAPDGTRDLSPDHAPGPSPDVAPDRAPGLSPDLSPDRSLGTSPDQSPDSSLPDLAQDRAPVIMLPGAPIDAPVMPPTLPQLPMLPTPTDAALDASADAITYADGPRSDRDDALDPAAPPAAPAIRTYTPPEELAPAGCSCRLTAAGPERAPGGALFVLALALAAAVRRRRKR
jgi:MYXO-CTERM domain-containing protein